VAAVAVVVADTDDEGEALGNLACSLVGVLAVGSVPSCKVA